MLHWAAVEKFKARHRKDGTNSDVLTAVCKKKPQQKVITRLQLRAHGKEYQATEEKVQNFEALKSSRTITPNIKF